MSSTLYSFKFKNNLSNNYFKTVTQTYLFYFDRQDVRRINKSYVIEKRDTSSMI